MSMSAAALAREPVLPAFEICEQGMLHVGIAGATASLRRAGSLWLQADSALVVGDLHFEKGSSYAARGQLLPPYDTRATLDRLEAEVAATAPRTLVFLGDSFHDGRAEERLHPAEAARLNALAAGRTLLWAVGNHDAEGPKSLAGEIVSTLSVGLLILRHEPLPGPALGEVAGHLHPCAKVSAAGRAVRRRAFVTDGYRLLLPAFGAYAGGLNVLDPAIAGLFDWPPLIGALGDRRVHPIGPAHLLAD